MTLDDEVEKALYSVFHLPKGPLLPREYVNFHAACGVQVVSPQNVKAKACPECVDLWYSGKVVL